jgi:signal transduction histidine kinase
MVAVAVFLAATSADELRWVDRAFWIEYPLLLSLIGGALAVAAGVFFGVAGLVGATLVLSGVAWLAAERLGDTVVLALQLPAFGAALALLGTLLRRLVAGWQRRRALSVGQEIQRLRSRISELEALGRTATAAETLGAASDTWLPLVDELARSGSALMSRLPAGVLSRNEADRFAVAVRDVRRALLEQSAMAGQFRLETQKEATLGDAVDEAVAATAGLCREHGVTLEVDTAQAGPPCAIDPKLLALAVAALVVNAAEASARGGIVTVLAHADYRGERGLIEVADRGSGIPPDNLSLVFKPFYTTRPGKVGLGLAMAKEIVGRMGGSIAVTANETRGMTFKIRIPMRRPELAGLAAERESPARTERMGQDAVRGTGATPREAGHETGGPGAAGDGERRQPAMAAGGAKREVELAKLAQTIELAQAASAARTGRRLEEEEQV